MGDDTLKAAQAPCQPEIAEPYYTLQEAAQEIGVTVNELQAAILNGSLAYTHQYGRKLLSPAAVAAYAARHVQTPPAQ